MTDEVRAAAAAAWRARRPRATPSPAWPSPIGVCWVTEWVGDLPTRDQR